MGFVILLLGMTKLREVMDEKGVTLAEISNATGLDIKTVWHATQSRKISRSTRISIAKFFDMAESDLFLPSDIPNPIKAEAV